MILDILLCTQNIRRINLARMTYLPSYGLIKAFLNATGWCINSPWPRRLMIKDMEPQVRTTLCSGFQNIQALHGPGVSMAYSAKKALEDCEQFCAYLVTLQP